VLELKCAEDNIASGSSGKRRKYTDEALVQMAPPALFTAAIAADHAYEEQRVFFVTDRNRDRSRDRSREYFGNDQQEAVQYGWVDVSIPRVRGEVCFALMGVPCVVLEPDHKVFRHV
jgi:hypothetical protein